ncbi:MAG: response regulator [Planctomycetota bacterium]|jgi:CheY-like chemotaxis protein
MFGLLSRRREIQEVDEDMANILVVGGNADHREHIHRLLEKEEHRVDEVESGKAGVNRATTETPDAIVLDDSLSDIDAVDFCREIRARAETAEIPILFLSTSRGVAEVDAAFRAGASNFLPLPFRSSQLLSKLATLLDEGGSGGEELSPVLEEAYKRMLDKSRILSDVAEVFPGINTGNNRKYLAEIERGPDWEPILMERDIQSHLVEYGGTHVYYHPRQLLRCPSKKLMQSKKVVVRRSAPPYTAAVDSERFLTESSVYNIIPAEGLACEYIAGVLNSRLMDFFLRRIRPLAEHPGVPTMLRSVDLEELPLVICKQSAQDAIVELVKELEAMGPYGERSRKATLRMAINRGVFEIYGFGKREIARLSELNF